MLAMEPASRNSEELQQNDDGGPPLFLGLPELGHQRSLQALIEDDLDFQNEESLEMAAVPLRRDQDSDTVEVSIEMPAGEAFNGRPRCSTSGERSGEGHKTTDVRRNPSGWHKRLWRRAFER